MDTKQLGPHDDQASERPNVRASERPSGREWASLAGDAADSRTGRSKLWKARSRVLGRIRPTLAQGEPTPVGALESNRSDAGERPLKESSSDAGRCFPKGNPWGAWGTTSREPLRSRSALSKGPIGCRRALCQEGPLRCGADAPSRAIGSIPVGAPSRANRTDAANAPARRSQSGAGRRSGKDAIRRTPAAPRWRPRRCG